MPAAAAQPPLEQFAVPVPTVPSAGPPPLMALPKSKNPPAAGGAAREPAVHRAREAVVVPPGL